MEKVTCETGEIARLLKNKRKLLWVRLESEWRSPKKRIPPCSLPPISRMPTSFADWRTKKSETLRAEDEEAVYLAVDARIDRPRLVGEFVFSGGAQIEKSAGEDN